jgi:hypothetical protein
MRILLASDEFCDKEKLPQEQVLKGGRLTAGVVRIGETVRRPASSASAFVALLLNHFTRVGFTGAPQYLGRDEQGRDSLSYIDGWVPAKFQYFTDTQIHAAGELLRAFHAATRGSSLVSDGTVICHHDAGPNNVVFQNDRPVAFIDFDLAAPGKALEDFGYMAWTWCVSSKSTRGPAALQARQVRILADAYGFDATERCSIIDAMLERQLRNMKFWTDRLNTKFVGPEETEGRVIDRVNWSKREMAFTTSKRSVFAAALR